MDQNVIEHKLRKRRLRNVPLIKMSSIDLLDYCYGMTLGVADTPEERRMMIHAMQESVAFMCKREESDAVILNPVKQQQHKPETPLPHPTRPHTEDTSRDFFI